MAKSVYIETTVVSYLTAWPSSELIRAAHQQITKEWWQSRRNDFDLFISEFVVVEASAGDTSAASDRLDILTGIPMLEVTSEIEMLAKELVERRAVPEKAATDALHISVAAIHNIDYLLSWNCRHIANAEMQGTIQTVCSENGFWFPRICTPEELLGDR
jgi:hypothetical protein